MISPYSIKNLTGHLSILIQRNLWAKILLALVLGSALGILASSSLVDLTPPVLRALAKWMAIPGEIFLRIVKMIVVPLVFSSIVAGIVGGASTERLKRLGLHTVLYFLMTTSVALSIGVGVGMLISPGEGQYYKTGPSPSVTLDELATKKQLEDPSDMLLNVLPNNPLLAMSSSNMTQVVFFAIIFAVAIVSLTRSESEPMIHFVRALQSICMKIVSWAMILAPVAVFGLTFRLTAMSGMDLIYSLGPYILTVMAGLALHFVFYSVLLKVMSGRSIFQFLSQTREAILLAFSTSSSASVMPLSMQVAQDKLKVSPTTSQFIIPLGTTINMDGTAIYQMVATMFLCQIYHIDLTMMEVVLVACMALGASIGTPGTPGVGIVILASILSSVGVPLEGTALIIGVDRIIDMCRTTLNVMGDLIACVVLDRHVR